MALRLAGPLVATGLLGASAGGCGGTLTVATAPRIPMAPAGVYVDDDVARGYAAYADAVAPAGRWSGDEDYGAHWCPSLAATGAPFRPYASRGHWAVSANEVYGAAPGNVYWVNDDPAPWVEITAHHGWWVDLGDRATGSSDWCWVPGARETPARVVWRTGDDFVGWAAEPPAWVDDGGENEQVGFEWTFELLGTLLEDAIDVFELAGDIAQLAADATSPVGRSGPAPGLSRRSPAASTVHAARDRLVAYAQTHATESSPAVASSTGTRSQAPAGHAASHAGAADSSSKQETADKPPVVVVEPLPPPGFFMPMVGLDPAALPAGGGGGVAPDRAGRTANPGALASGGPSLPGGGLSSGRSIAHTAAPRAPSGAWSRGPSVAPSRPATFAHGGGSSGSSHASSGHSSGSSSHSSSSTAHHK
jgi:hypothetical protein